MAIAFESVGAGARSASATSISPGAPAGVAVGDLLVLCTCSGGSVGADTPSNWDLVKSQTHNSSSAISRMFMRIADGGSDDTPAVTRSTSGTIGAVIVRISGQAATPLDVTWSAQASDPVSIPDGTIAENGSLIVAQVSAAAASGAPSITAGTYSIEYDGDSSPTLTVGIDLADAGADGAGTFDYVSPTIRYAYIAAAFKPATGTVVTTNLGTLTLTEYAATITRDVNVLASTRSMTLTPYAATITTSGAVNVTTNLRSLTLTEYPATISVNREITTNLRSLTLTEYPATISVSADTNVQTNLRSLTLTEYPATITRNVEVLANTRSLTLTEYPATIDTAGTVEVVTNLRSLTLTEYPATISVNREVLASAVTLSLTEYPASITINREVLAGTESMSLTTYPASITSGAAGKILKINGLYIYHP